MSNRHLTASVIVFVRCPLSRDSFCLSPNIRRCFQRQVIWQPGTVVHLADKTRQEAIMHRLVADSTTKEATTTDGDRGRHLHSSRCRSSFRFSNVEAIERP